MQVIIEYLNTQLSDLENERMSKETLLNSKIIEANEVKKTISKLTLNDNDTYNVFNASGSKIGFQNKEVINLKQQEDVLRQESDYLTEEIKEINLKIESIAIAIGHANACNSKIKTLNNELIRLNGELAMYSTGGKKFKADEIEISEVTLINEIREEQILSDNTESDNRVTGDSYINLNDENLIKVEQIDSELVLDEKEKISLSSTIETLDIDMENNKFLEEISDRVFFVSRILKFDPIRVKLELDEIYKAIIKFINK